MAHSYTENNAEIEFYVRKEGISIHAEGPITVDDVVKVLGYLAEALGELVKQQNEPK